MAGFTDPRPPLPQWVLESYEQLRSHACQPDHGDDGIRSIDYQDAIDVLETSPELELEREDAEYALMRLLDRGYFYEIDDQLRVTSPEEQC